MSRQHPIFELPSVPSKPPSPLMWCFAALSGATFAGCAGLLIVSVMGAAGAGPTLTQLRQGQAQHAPTQPAQTMTPDAHEPAAK